MADCAIRAKVANSQHEGRVVILTGPNGQYQTINPVTDKVTDVTVIDAKYDKYFDDPMYYTS